MKLVPKRVNMFRINKFKESISLTVLLVKWHKGSDKAH